jgi:hypothetical protein
MTNYDGRKSMTKKAWKELQKKNRQGGFGMNLGTRDMDIQTRARRKREAFRRIVESVY